MHISFQTTLSIFFVFLGWYLSLKQAVLGSVDDMKQNRNFSLLYICGSFNGTSIRVVLFFGPQPCWRFLWIQFRPSVRPSVTAFSQDWVITVFWFFFLFCTALGFNEHERVTESIFDKTSCFAQNGICGNFWG